MDDRDALTCFARHAVQHLSISKSIFGEHVSSAAVTEKTSEQIRRRLALGAMVPMLDVPDVHKYSDIDHLRYTGLVHPDDFPWYLDQVRSCGSSSTARERWVRVAFQGYDPGNVVSTQLLWDLKEEGIGGPVLNSAFDAVALDSEEANRERRRWEVFHSTEDPDSQADEPFAAVSKVAQFLEDIAAGKFDAWRHLDFWLQADSSGIHRGGVGEWEADIRTFPGWALCDQETQRGIVSGANAYLRANHPNSEWFGTLDGWRHNLAAFRAFVLLHEEDPALLQSLPDNVWKDWGPLFLAFPPKTSADEIPLQRVFLARAVESGFEMIDTLRLIAQREGDEAAYVFSSAFKAASAVADVDGRVQLADEFINVKVNPAIAQEATRVLVEGHKDSHAAELAVSVAKTYAMDEGTRAVGAQVAGHILLSQADTFWDDLWPVVSESDHFRHAVYHVICWRDRHDAKVSAMLNERQLSDLYLTLAREFPPSDDPDVQGHHEIGFREQLGWWRESVLNHLAQRGTWAAAKELKRLAGELPEVEWLPIRVAQARELARSATWTPPTPEGLMEIVRTPNKRMVESTGQLQEVILKSLADLQEELLAETPAAAYYWNHPNTNEATPKDELEVSNYIKRHLDQDLAHSGIVINREVENRRGNETDIYVQAIRTDDHNKRADVITVVCEVKGCWNRELYTSQKEQLLDRYLIENGHTHGIYIAAYFDGDRWQKSDRASRHKNCKKHTVEELRDELTVQSQSLSGDGKVLRTVVLDINF